MSELALRSLIAQAVVDPQFCSRLLDGERQHVLAEYDLSDEERSALVTFTTVSLQAFACQLEAWLDGRN